MNFENAVICLQLTPAAKTPKILKQIDLQDYFDTISDGTNIKKSKPDPKDFLKAAEMLGHAPTDCLVVEDAMAGIEAAFKGGF